MSRMPRNFGYVRESTIKQVDSPLVQREAITAYAAGVGGTIDVWVMDPATSSRIPLHKRDGGREMMAQLRRGDVVWVSKLDRAWRSCGEFCITIAKWAQKGIEVRIANLQGQYDIRTPEGKAFVQLMAVFAELEREMISVRTKEALALRKKRGLSNGRYAGYGFKWRKVLDKTTGRMVKHKVKNPEERAVMRQIMMWYLNGTPFEGIYWHMRKHKVKTTEGKEWSLDRIKRAYKAELLLQAAEGPRGSANGQAPAAQA